MSTSNEIIQIIKSTKDTIFGLEQSIKAMEQEYREAKRRETKEEEVSL